MSGDLVKFHLPAAFVASRVRLDPDELAYGYSHGWLDDASTVSLAEDLVVGGSASPPVEELAGLFRSDLWRVQGVIDEIDETPGADPTRVWLYLALAWLHDRQDQHADPLQVVEMLYSDFAYPPEIEGLVRYMPPPPGAHTGVEAIEERWREYLQQRSEEYARRH